MWSGVVWCGLVWSLEVFVSFADCGTLGSFRSSRSLRSKGLSRARDAPWYRARQASLCLSFFFFNTAPD